MRRRPSVGVRSGRGGTAGAVRAKQASGAGRGGLAGCCRPGQRRRQRRLHAGCGLHWHRHVHVLHRGQWRRYVCDSPGDGDHPRDARAGRPRRRLLEPGFVGTDSFTYCRNSSHLPKTNCESNVANVTITVTATHTTTPAPPAPLRHARRLIRRGRATTPRRSRRAQPDMGSPAPDRTFAGPACSARPCSRWASRARSSAAGATTLGITRRNPWDCSRTCAS